MKRKRIALIIIVFVGLSLVLLGIFRNAVTGKGENSEPEADWLVMFRDIAKMESSENSEYKYALVYVDEDDIPELVVDYPDYYVSLYKFIDGTAKPVMDKWPYGVMGNIGYEYAPQKNCISNLNLDYAGLIEYVSYCSIHKNNSVESDFYEKILNFDDLDGDEIPSPGEEKAAESGVSTGKSLYLSDNDSMSEAEIKAEIDRIDRDYEFESLKGKYDYEEFIKYLEEYTNP